MKYLTILAALFSISFLTAQELEVEGELRIGATDNTDPTPGTIRWTGFDFEGWNGEAWVSLSGGKTGPIQDLDGNSYSTITIGEQIWMAENLKTSKYASGTPIPQIPSNLVWDTVSTGAWCWYENYDGFEEPYGKLYNWHAVSGDSLCPEGWHVPTKDEWDLMVDYIGGLTVAGGKLKSRGTDYWVDPNEMGINSSGFNGLPGGVRKFTYTPPVFEYQTTQGRWWSKTEGDMSSRAWRYILSYDDGEVYVDMNDKGWGLSVRCIRDN